jgi:hypothetical protein
MSCKPILRDLSREKQPLASERISATCQIPIGVPQKPRWLAYSRPRRFAWLQTPYVARSPTGYTNPCTTSSGPSRRRGFPHQVHAVRAAGACVSSNHSAGTAIALGHAQIQFDTSSRCPRQLPTETNEWSAPTQSAGLRTHRDGKYSQPRSRMRFQ